MADEERVNDCTFNEWRSEVNRLRLGRFCESLDNLPDLMTWDAWHDGVPPDEFFEDDVMEMMREEYGSIIDKL